MEPSIELIVSYEENKLPKAFKLNNDVNKSNKQKYHK